MNARVIPPPRNAVVIALAVAIGAVLYAVACAVGESYGLAFFAIPVFVGFPAGLLAPKRPYRAAWQALAIALLIGVATLREGVVCVIFALPILMPMLMLGAWSGSILSRHVKTRDGQARSIGIMVLLGFGWQLADAAADDVSKHPVHVAESSIVLLATAEHVFATLTAGELRVAQRWPWFIRFGLPMPEAMIVERPGPSGRLRFEFAHVKAFAHVTTWQPPHELAYAIDGYEVRDLPFHITRLGRSPDYGLRAERVEDWLTVLDTRYTLEAAPSAGTRLRRRVVWQRHLAPDLYFGWLQQTVMERGQARLLELIVERVKAAEPNAPARSLDLWSARGSQVSNPLAPQAGPSSTR